MIASRSFVFLCISVFEESQACLQCKFTSPDICQFYTWLIFSCAWYISVGSLHIRYHFPLRFIQKKVINDGLSLYWWTLYLIFKNQTLLTKSCFKQSLSSHICFYVLLHKTILIELHNTHSKATKIHLKYISDALNLIKYNPCD